jgi:hypothetical protein
MPWHLPWRAVDRQTDRQTEVTNQTLTLGTATTRLLHTYTVASKLASHQAVTAEGYCDHIGMQLTIRALSTASNKD